MFKKIPFLSIFGEKLATTNKPHSDCLILLLDRREAEMPKVLSIGGYSYFVRTMRAQLEKNAGRPISMEEAVQLCAPLWTVSTSSALSRAVLVLVRYIVFRN